MPIMLKHTADNVDNCAKSPRYPISALCAPASSSPAGWAPSYVCIKYSMAGRGAAARFHHNTNAEHTDEVEHRI